MHAATHHIRSQRWQIKTTSPATAFAMRQELRTQLETLLLPAFERAFDAFAAADQVLHIPSLRLQLRVREGSNLTAELARLIEEELRLALHASVRTAIGDDRASPSAVAGKSAAAPRVQTRSAAEHRRALLVEYLTSGRISWQSETQQPGSVLAWLKEEAELLASDRPVLDKIILGTFETRLAISFRLLQLLVPSTRATLLAQRATYQPDNVVTVLRELTAQQLPGSFLQLRVAALLLALNDADLAAIAQGLPISTAVGSLEELFANSHHSARPPAGESSIVRLARIADNLLGLTGTNTAAQTENAQPPGRVPNDALPTAANTAPAAQQTSSEMRPQGKGVVPAMGPDETPADQLARRVMAVEPAAAPHVPGLLVHDAGAILLHPFLPRLLESTHVTAAGGRSLATAQLPRAAALLHWLVTGRDEVFEFELALIKVLLGLTPDDPLVVAQGLLSDSDRAEGDALLAAVIEHWTALRKTTVAGLRASFLQRRGLLRDNDGAWWLRVEAEPFDMLLGQLPWGISVTKLPWMTKPIFTDWPTP